MHEWNPKKLAKQGFKHINPQMFCDIIIQHDTTEFVHRNFIYVFLKYFSITFLIFKRNIYIYIYIYIIGGDWAVLLFRKIHNLLYFIEMKNVRAFIIRCQSNLLSTVFVGQQQIWQQQVDSVDTGFIFTADMCSKITPHTCK